MSQHTFNTTSTGNEAIRVMVGFDNPLGRFFYTVFKDGEVIRSSIEEPEIEFDSLGLLGSLAGQGIAIPKPLIDQLALEGMFGSSNNTKEWPNHTPTAVETALLALGFMQQMESCLPPSSEAIWALPIHDCEDFMALASSTLYVYLPTFLLSGEQVEANKNRTLTDDELLAVLNEPALAGKVKELTHNQKAASTNVMQ